MKLRTRIEISVAAALIISLLIPFIGFGAKCSEIRNDVIRLHILANSDSEADQQVKLKVRDALLGSGEALFSGAADVDNAADILAGCSEHLTRIAEDVLLENGFDYGVKIYLVKEFFSTRSYEDFTLPAGRYLAVKVILGKGEGHNWWCVMFPPLCLPAVTEKPDMDAVFGERGAELIEDASEYEIRFKAVEIYEKIKNKLVTLCWKN